MARFAFAFDANKCTGCKVCAAACKDKNDLAAGRKFRKVYVMATGGWSEPNAAGTSTHQKVGGYNLSIACMHCEEPACKPVCPVGAIGKRPDGIVYIDQNLCIGCQSCVTACPYGAPSFDKTQADEANGILGKTNKCDFCRDSIAAGEQPACVGACVGRALDCGEYDDMVAKYGTENVIQPLPAADTKPSYVVKPHRNFPGKEGMVHTGLPEEIQAHDPE